jgi:hypothetical protein
MGGLMRRFAIWISWVALLPSLLQGVTLTSFNPTVHKAALVFWFDDYIVQQFHDSAEVIGVPLVWAIDPAENDEGGAEATRRALIPTVHALNHEIAGHTGAAGAMTSSTTVAQARAIFQTTQDFLEDQGITDAVSWTYYGNDWTTNSQSVVGEYFPGMTRLRRFSSDTSPDTVTVLKRGRSWSGFPDGFTNGPTYLSENPHPIPMVNLREMVYMSSLCDSCHAQGRLDDDTVGTWDNIDELVQIRGLGVPSFHAGSDISITQFSKVARYVLSRGDIWVCTAKQIYDLWGTDLTAARVGSVIYCDSTYLSGPGSAARPTGIAAAAACWGRVAQLNSGTYVLENLVQSDHKLVVRSNITIRGPATISTNVGASAINVTLSTAPGDGVWTNYYPRFANVTFRSYSPNATGNRSVSIAADQAVFDSCSFTGPARVLLGCGSANIDNIKILRCTFSIDSAGATPYGHYAIQRTGATNTGWAFINNKVVLPANGENTATTYGWYQEQGSATTDSLLNNQFMNLRDSNSFVSIFRSAADNGTRPYYRWCLAGNDFRAPTITKNKVDLAGSSSSSLTAAFLDSLSAYTVTNGGWTFWNANGDVTAKCIYGTSTSVNDTTKWGGVPLSYMGTDTYWGSTGPTQYNTGTPFVAPQAWGSYSETARLDTPQDILALINAGVLPRADSLNIDGGTTAGAGPWYRFPPIRSLAEEAQTRSYMSIYYAWAESDRQKIRWYVDGARYLVYSPTGARNYAGIWALYAAVGGAETQVTTTDVTTWFRIQQPRTIEDRTMAEHYLRMWELWPSGVRNTIAFKVNGASDLSLNKATSSNGLWAAIAKVDGAQETTSSSNNAASWFTFARPRSEAEMAMVSSHVSAWNVQNSTDQAKVMLKVR